MVLLAFSSSNAGTLPIGQRQSDSRPHLAYDVVVHKHHSYLGEHIPFTLRIVYDPRTYTIHQIVPPTMPDIGLEFLQKSQKESQNINGVSCTVFEVEGVLYPKKTGSLGLEPFTINADQRSTTARGFMGLIMNSTLTLFTDRVPLNVQPLPPTSKKTYGFVGDYGSVTLEIDQTHFAAGEAVVVKYHLKGKGNAAVCNHPPLYLPELLKCYPAESKKESDGHCFEYALQAIESGDLLIPAQSFVFFNPYYKTYQELKTLPTWVHISAPKYTAVPDSPPVEIIEDMVEHEQEQQEVVEPVSMVRNLYIPDMLFGFLTVLGILCLCVKYTYAWVFSYLYDALAWWRYRKLLAKARSSVKKLQHNADVEATYVAFKELKTMLEWNHIRKNKKIEGMRSDAWHLFWQRMECARFDTDRSCEIPHDFIQEALQWVTYFEKS